MRYYPKIDGLRCIAICAVLLHHLGGFSNYVNLGYFGVDLFFVISGFLITLLLLKTQGSFKKAYSHFLARRALRIFPLYYFALLILYLVTQPIVKDNMVYLLTYTFNYRLPFISDGNPVRYLWSLSLEEQYYLFWPLFVLALKNCPKLLMALVSLIIVFGYVQLHFNIIPSISIYNYTGLATRMGSLGFGSLGAMLFLQQSKYLDYLLCNKYIEYCMLVFWLFAIFLLNPFLIGIGSLYMVLKAANNSFQLQKINKLLVHRKVLYIAKISYGLYVYHIIVIYYLTPYMFDPFFLNINFEMLGPFKILRWHSWIVKLPLYFSVTIILSDLSYRYFEKPFLKLKRYFV